MRGEILTTIDDNYSRQLLTIIYNKNTARCAYKNNQKSSAYLLFLPKRMQQCCIGEQNKKNN